MNETITAARRTPAVRTTPILAAGAIAAVVAATILYGYGALARSLGMTMHVGEPRSSLEGCVRLR